MKPSKKLNQKRIRRVARVRALISGTAERPRLAVHRTNRYLYAQLIDDERGRTILSASSFAGLKSPEKSPKGTKTETSFAVGELIGKKAVEQGIKVAVFDRRSYKFHGRVKSFVEGAKKSGLKI